jgi:hypothetical protein
LTVIIEIFITDVAISLTVRHHELVVFQGSVARRSTGGHELGAVCPGRSIRKSDNRICNRQRSMRSSGKHLWAEKYGSGAG